MWLAEIIFFTIRDKKFFKATILSVFPLNPSAISYFLACGQFACKYNLPQRWTDSCCPYSITDIKPHGLHSQTL